MTQQLTNFASVYMPIVITDDKSIQATIQGGGAELELNAETFNGNAELRLDGVLRNMLDSGRIEKDDRVHIKFLYDKELNVCAIIDSVPYHFMRNVADETNRLLTNMPKLKNYPNYECGVCYKANGLELIEIGSQRVVQEDLRFEECVITAVICDGSSGELTVSRSYFDSSIVVERADEPSDPFYVRWLNRFGGWDYFMFGCRRKVTHALVSNTSYERYGADGQKTTLKKEGQDIVEVSSGKVDAQTLRELLHIAYSPDIRLYKKDTQEWVPIQYAGGDNEYMTDQPTGEVVLQFEMPSPRMQC